MIVRLSPHQHTTTMAEVCYLLADDALKSGYNKYVCCIKYTFFWNSGFYCIPCDSN